MSKLPFSKGWITLILGPLSGLWIIMQHPDEVNTIIGAVVTIVTTVTALYHDIAEQQIKTQQPTSQAQTVSEPQVQ